MASRENNVIDILAIISICWQRKIFIVLCAVAFAIAGFVIQLFLPDQYRTEVILIASNQNSEGGIGALTGQFGGLASLAGISMGGLGGTNTSEIHLQTIKSRAFINSFVEHEGIAAKIFAANGWSPEADKLYYDDEIYNPTDDGWLRQPTLLKSSSPSQTEIYNAWNEIVSIKEDPETNLIHVTLTYYSPYEAVQIVTSYVDYANQYLKRKAKQDANQSLEYLTREIRNTLLEGNRQLLFQLKEEQMKTLMLTEVKEEFAFQTIDPAYLPDGPAKPKRLLFILIFFLIGFVISSCFFIVKQYR